jgi:iron complex outermembrane receptor protein
MKFNRIVLGSTGVLSGALLLTSGPAAAQSASAAAMLEEVVVTARRREESLQDLPLSIAAISSEQMQAQGIFSIDDATEYVPNLVLTTDNRANNNRVVIRGIGGGHPDPIQVFGSGMYIDGHYIPNSLGGYMSTLDIERIEVLRGPQGTLFGKNVTGGAVNIVSVKPQPEFDSSINLRIAEDGDENFRGMINVPFSDTVYGRFSIASEQFDGYYYNQFLNRDSGSEDLQSVVGAIRFQPNDEWTIDASINFSEQRGDNAGGACIGDPNGDAPLWGGGTGNLERRLYTGAQADFIALCDADNAAGDFINSSDKRTFSNVDTNSFFISAEYRPSDTTRFKANASTRDVDYWYLADRDYTSWPVDHIGTVDRSSATTNETTGFELLFESSPNDRLDFTVGFNYFEEIAHVGGSDNCYQLAISQTDPSAVVNCAVTGLHFELVPNNPTGTGLWPNGPRLNNGGPGPFFNNVSVWNESVGVFGHLTYTLNDNWDLDVGARWTEDERRFNNIEFPSTGCDISVDPNNMCAITLPVSQDLLASEGFFNSAQDTFSEVTPMISLTRNLQGGDVLDSGMIYFLYSEGFLTGGFNTEINSNLPAVSEFLSFEPENVDNFEVGFKGTFANGNAQVMVSVFHMDYVNQQRQVNLDNPDFLFGADDPIGIVQNVAESTITGLEFELRAAPWDGGFVSLDVASLNNEYDNYSYVDPGTGNTTDFSDRLIEDFTPDLTATFAVEHEFALSTGTLTPRVAAIWQDDYEWAASRNDWPTNAPRSPCFQESYARVDARLAYVPNDGNWQFAVYGQNLTDERAWDFCESERSVWRGRYIRPAYWGLEFTANFGN